MMKVKRQIHTQSNTHTPGTSVRTQLIFIISLAPFTVCFVISLFTFKFFYLLLFISFNSSVCRLLQVPTILSQATTTNYPLLTTKLMLVVARGRRMLTQPVFYYSLKLSVALTYIHIYTQLSILSSFL